jgi:hypothetical protein
MMVAIPSEVLDVCIAVENASGVPTLGIGFEPEMWCWVLSDQHGEIYAKLSAQRFGVPPEVEVLS